jgi:phosphatidylglycerophosphatase A
LPEPRPDLRFLLARPAHFLALGLGSGLSRVAPGTFGTLLGWLLFYPLDAILTPVTWACFLVIAFVLGVKVCSDTGRDLGVADHGSIVFDEMVAIWCVLVMLPTDWRWHLVGVLVFRFFDIVKPPPISYFDRRFKGGFGVMWDDLFAAFYSLLLIALIIRVVHDF